MSDLTIEELKEQIKRYEQELQSERAKNYVRRDRIITMSSEVVDSNPYRYHIFLMFYSQSKFQTFFCEKQSIDGS
jgi:hypothetical protein